MDEERRQRRSRKRRWMSEEMEQLRGGRPAGDGEGRREMMLREWGIQRRERKTKRRRNEEGKEVE